MRFFRVLRSRRGIGLIQILVGSFIASLISLGVAQMMQQARISQRRIGLMTTLSELQKRINFMIMDQGAFGITINSGDNVGAPFTALQAGTAQAGLGGPVKINLHDSSGDPANTLNLLGPAEMTGNGFTEKGTPCTNFNANPGAGVDECPISYRLMISWTCPTITSCVEPMMVIAARLVFNPSTQPNRILQRFMRLIPQGPANTTSAPMKFDVLVRRTGSSIAREFKLAALIPASSPGGTCGASSNLVGAGVCSTGAPANHPIFGTTNWVEDYDPHNLVTVGVAGGFYFNDSGSYSCSVKGYAYNTGTADIMLYDVSGTTTVGSATTFAGATAGSGSTGAAESLLRLDVSVTVPSLPSHTFKIYQKCQATGFPVTPAICSMGFTKTPAADYQALSLICTKLDQAF